MSCFHTYGAIGKMDLYKGKAIAEEGGIVYLVNAKVTNTTTPELEIEEKDGGKFIIPAGVKTSEVSTSIAKEAQYNISGLADNTDVTYDNTSRTNGDYEISNLTQLKTFRNLVNGGFNFKGTTVSLKSDIKLDDGWTPIGEGSRDVAKTGTSGSYASGTGYFSGIFNGNNHIISNLNNNGYHPNGAYLDDGRGFVYGFFGILADGADIQNLDIKGANIDTINDSVTCTDGTKAKGDSVGCLVGFCSGMVSFNNITVENDCTVKAADAVGGVIGRWYNVNKYDANKNKTTSSVSYTKDNATTTVETGSYEATLTKVINNADVYSQCKGGGIVGFTKYGKYAFKNCSNNGIIHVTVSSGNYAADQFINHQFSKYTYTYNNSATDVLKYQFDVSFDNSCSSDNDSEKLNCTGVSGSKSMGYGVWTNYKNNTVAK